MAGSSLCAATCVAGVGGPFELVVSNPPYVDPADWETLQPEIRLYEPRSALVGSGVAHTIARAARPLLAPGGWLVLEVGDGQAGALADTARGTWTTTTLRSRATWPVGSVSSRGVRR